MENEIKFSDNTEVVEKVIRGGQLKLTAEDLPIKIEFEGRKRYVLKLTGNDKLLLNKAE